jgi:hypothetical protein
LEHIGRIKDLSTALRSGGCDRREATAQVMELFDTLEERERLTFWIGLADAQYTRKELTVSVAVYGLLALHRLEHQLSDITPGDLERRRRHYSQAPMPERKLGRPRKNA